MEEKVVVVFSTPKEGQATKIFTEQPLGMKFARKLPIVINKIDDGSPAAQLGVKLGWKVHSINGKVLIGMDVHEACAIFVHSVAPLRQKMLVRRTPLDAISVNNLSAKLKSPVEVEDVPFLRHHGFQAQSSASWGNNVVRPELHFEIDCRREIGKSTLHTWYLIVGTVVTGEASSTRRWAVERRLAHMRALLHDPVKHELGNKYNHYFKDARFARHGGPCGTTARMRLWLAALSRAILAGAVPPALVASMFHFLEVPSLSEHERRRLPTAEQTRAIAGLTATANQSRDDGVKSGTGACKREVPGDENGLSLQDGIEQDDPQLAKGLCQEVDLLESMVDDALDAESNEEAPCGVLVMGVVEDDLDTKSDEEMTDEVVSEHEGCGGDDHFENDEGALSEVANVSGVEDDIDLGLKRSTMA